MGVPVMKIRPVRVSMTQLVVNAVAAGWPASWQRMLQVRFCDARFKRRLSG